MEYLLPCVLPKIKNAFPNPAVLGNIQNDEPVPKPIDHALMFPA
jgi:hypothetical protein